VVGAQPAQSRELDAWRPPSQAVKLAMLGALYFVEGMPWGFQSKALPVYLRTTGVSLTSIGLLSVLSLPWMLKVLWAPLVDKYGAERFGRRKSWIVPLQVALAAFAVAAAFAAQDMHLPSVLALIFAMNVCAAGMDVAVDGLAVDLLRPTELGPGNSAQVVGYKVGSLTSGGLLVGMNDWLGWSGQFAVTGIFVALVALATLFFREPPPGTKAGDEPTVRDIVALLFTQIRRPGMATLFLFIATYKTGEQLVDSMLKPFLIDKGYSAAQVANWVSTIGMGASIAGSLLGGFLVSRANLLHAVGVAAAVRALPVAAACWLTTTQPTPTTIVIVAVTENFFGGVLTTIMFAYMMSRTDRRIGATHFTLLATIEMIGKAPIPILAGLLAQHHSYTLTFGLGAVLSLLYLGLLVPMRRAQAIPVEDD
jgi:MFS transporter, PAT family, beta-lactamase induction signal transducer AmpG